MLNIELKCEFMVDDCAKKLVCVDLFDCFIVDTEWRCGGVTAVEVDGNFTVCPFF